MFVFYNGWLLQGVEDGSERESLHDLCQWACAGDERSKNKMAALFFNNYPKDV